MKLAKRFLTAGVALALTLGLNIPAFAANITINNAVEKENYTAYKLFSLSKSGEGDTAKYSYYIDNTEDNANLIKLLDVTIGLDLVESADGSRYNVNMKDANTFAADDDEDGMTAAELAAALNTNKNQLPNSDLTGTCATGSSSVTITVPDTGYYFVDSSLGALCGLYTNEDRATINEKNSKPSIAKTVQEDSSSAWGETATIDGEVDTINYKLTVNTGTGVTGLGNGVDSDYTITDVLPAGIAYNEGSIVLPKGWTAYNAETQTGDYTVSYAADTRTLTIVLKASKLAALGQNANIEITYNADAKDVAGNLTVGTEHKNIVTLTYKQQTMTDEAVVKTYDLGTTTTGTPAITKVDGSETPVPLQGVKFVLSKTVTVPAEGEDEPTTKTVYATFTNNYLTGWVDSQDGATELVTDNNGNIKAEGLDADTYTLTETETLPGYNLLNDTITVVIDENGNETYKLTSSKDKPKDRIEIVNEAGSQLPTTGGMGTTVLYIAGAVLVLGAGITLVVRRRMNSDQ